MSPIDVYSFGPAWNIPVPTASPFGLKLLAWMRMYEIPYALHIENNPGKGPKGKCPWVVIGNERLGDSELVIERLRASAGRDLDAGLTAEQRAIAIAVRRMLDEHYHQAWEHQLFIADGAWPVGKTFFDQLPPGARVLVRNLARSSLRKQLHARGLGRHGERDIIQMGIADIDAVAALLGDKPYFFGDTPTDIDATVFAFLALTQYVPSPSPMFEHVRAQPRLTAYCERLVAHWFG
jgi:glutathione S-transferase